MFKVGDGVICIDETFADGLEKGRVYIVSSVVDPLLAIKGMEEYSWYQERFKKIEDNAINRLLYPEVNWSNYEN